LVSVFSIAFVKFLKISSFLNPCTLFFRLKIAKARCFYSDCFQKGQAATHLPFPGRGNAGGERRRKVKRAEKRRAEHRHQRVSKKTRAFLPGTKIVVWFNEKEKG